jgi:hypothetical protein
MMTDSDPSISRACSRGWFAELARIDAVSREVTRREQAGDQHCGDARAWCDYLLEHMVGLSAHWVGKRTSQLPEKGPVTAGGWGER